MLTIVCPRHTTTIRAVADDLPGTLYDLRREGAMNLLLLKVERKVPPQFVLPGNLRYYSL